MAYNGFVAAADTANLQAGGDSFFDQIGMALTAGTAGVAVSGLQSIYNTGVDLSNNVFGTELERADVAETLNRVDTSWGDYYAQNKSAIDTIGFVAGSFIPGGLAVKGLKAIQRGEASGAFASALRFASDKEAFYLKKGLDELATEGGTIFTRINANKLKAAAFGTLDQTLQAATYELATVASMKASPMLDKEDWGALGWDIAKTGIIGGAIGGTIGGLVNAKLFKDVGKEVEKRTRLFDVLRNPGNVDMDLGDRAFGIIDSLSALPTEVVDSLAKVPVASLRHELNLKGLLEKTLQKTGSEGVQKFESLMTHAVENDSTVGKPVAAAFLRILKEGLDAGADQDEIRKTFAGYLLGMKGISGIGKVPADITNNIVHLPKNPSLTGDISKLFGKEAFDGGTSYRVVGDLADMKQGVLGKDAMSRTDLWEAGFDTAIDPATKQLFVNPKSQILFPIKPEETGDLWLYFNMRSRKMQDTVVPTIADIATPAQPLKINATGVQSGGQSFAFSVGNFNPEMTALEATARHAWATQSGMIFKGTIDSRDFSILDSLLFDHAKATADLKIRLPSGVEVPFADVGNFREFVQKQKLDAVMEKAAAGPTSDLRELAQQLNVDPSWLQNTAVATKFDRKAMSADTFGWLQDPAQYQVRENAIFKYATPNMSDGTPEAIAQWWTRVKEAQQRSQTAAAEVLGEAYEKLLPLQAGVSLTEQADQLGVGASFFGASNANYNDPLKMFAQATGSTTHQIIESMSNDVLLAIKSPAAKLLTNAEASMEVAAAIAKVRGSKELFHLYTDASGKHALVDLASLDGVRSGKLRGFTTMIPLSEDAGAFLATHQQLHADWIAKNSKLLNAHGEVSRFNPDAFYAPPIDTTRFKYFAFVRQTEGRVFGSSDVSIITARDAAELEAKAAQVQKIPGLEVHFKADTEAYHKAKRDFDFSRAMNETQVDNLLRREGILNDAPLINMQPEAIVQEFVGFAQRRTEKLVRDAVSANYAQQFAELEALSQRYTAASLSAFEGTAESRARNVANPFGDYIKTALDISKQSEFTLWHKTNEFLDSVGTRAFRAVESAVLDARQGKVSWEQANATMEKFGIGKMLQDEEMFWTAQSLPEKSLLRSYVNKANALLSTAVLRLDWANSIVNVISTPILLGTEVSAIRNSLKNDPEFLAQWGKLFGIEAGDVTVPSTTKLIAKAIKNSFGADGKALTERYKQIGTIKGDRALVHEMLDDLSIMKGVAPREWGEKVDKWVDKAASVTFSNQAEEFTRFVSSDVMRQITQPLVDAGKMGVQEQNAFMQIFTNRVQGNYVASQRPIMFQGVLGSAIGLFQTYQFNTLQQLFRHVEDKSVKTLATFGALQSSLYGLNGLPFFDAVNTHLIGSAHINEGHKDVFSFATESAGKQVGDMLMYGTASAFPLFGDRGPALYSRGDLNPRSAFIVPTSLADVPAVSGAMKVIQAVAGFGDRIANGGSFKDSLLFGLEHNGINRPLAGFAQLLKGNVTTQTGDLIAAQGDMYSIASMSRLIGARPMDEALAISERYRTKVYQALDKQRLEALGTVVKDKLRNNQPITSEDWLELQGRYAAAGGRVQGFVQAMHRWEKNANTSVINQLTAHQDTLAGRRMIETMGGTPLEDYTNQATE